MYPKLSFTKLLTFIKELSTNAVWLVIPLGDVHLSLTSVNSAAASIVSALKLWMDSRPGASALAMTLQTDHVSAFTTKVWFIIFKL